MSNLHPRWQQLLGSLVGAHFYGDAKDILVRVLAEHDADENERLRAERDECVALLESYGNDMLWSSKMEALRAKLRTP